MSPNSVAPTIVNPLANAEVKELETGVAEGSLGSVDKTAAEKRSTRNETNLKDANMIFKKNWCIRI